MPKLRFGPNIRKLRIKSGLSQSELGKKLSPQLSPTMISNWEHEYLIPSEDQKRQLRRILGQDTNGSDTSKLDHSHDEEITENPSAVGVWLNRCRLEKNMSVPELAAQAGLSTVAIYNIESGRSQNPQPSTILKIEDALGMKLSAEVKDETKDEATIDGVGEWFDFDPNSISDWPDEAGIYVLYDISNRPIYVGQGQKISTRLRDHHQKFWFRAPIVQYASYVGIESKDLREKIEKVVIKFLKTNAVLNQQNVDR